jgi:hypothetical protein
VAIGDTSDIFKHSNQLRETVKRYLGSTKDQQPGDQQLAASEEAEPPQMVGDPKVVAE